jgi:16S rRNA (cytosine1402-N4)-methyltransferase
MEFVHTSVLPEVAVEKLNCRPGGTYVDCTLGGGGHARRIIERIEPGGTFIGIDQDINAINYCRNLLNGYDVGLMLIHTNFSRLKQVVEQPVDGIIFDLGVSSPQLDQAERGFSYMQDAPLDMRMNSENPLSAKEIVNSYSEEQLNTIIWQYGEERWAKRIAKFIVSEREEQSIQTTGQLVEIIKKAIPAGARREGPHPAKRTFQALRIAVNDELNVLGQSLQDAVDLLKPGGRIAVITFHSLEDRIVKGVFGQNSKSCICPPELPICQCGGKPVLKLITRRPIVPSEEELKVNPRSRSAKLRVAEKLS